MEDQTFWAWGLYGLALTLQWIFWRDLAATAFVMAQLKGGPRTVLVLRWPMFAMALSFLAWPIFAMTRLDYGYQAGVGPRVLMLASAVGFAWIASRLTMALVGVMVGPPPEDQSVPEGVRFVLKFLAAAGCVVTTGLVLGGFAWFFVYYDLSVGY